MRIDPETVAVLIREVVEAEVLPRFRNLAKTDIFTKTGPTDLVTAADLGAEAALTRRLRDLLPGSAVVGEEAVHSDPRVLEALGREPGPVWILDPVDGTGNFTRGDSKFACVVALAVEGETVMGWIDHCTERRVTWAQRGAGAWCEGHPARVPDPPPVGAGFASRRAGDLTGLSGLVGGRPLARALSDHGATVRRVTSAAHAYLALLAGDSDFAGFSRMHAWDHAAGILLYQEAGGTARLACGAPYRPTARRGMPLMAPDPGRWQVLAEVIRKAGVMPADAGR